MASKPVTVTKQGLDKLQKELDQLLTVRRAEVARRIPDAKELVGAQNTPEYEDARNEQAFVEGSPFNESLLVASVLILRRVLCANQLLGIVNALGYFGAAHGQQLIKLLLKLVQALFGELDRFACHGVISFLRLGEKKD